MASSLRLSWTRRWSRSSALVALTLLGLLAGCKGQTTFLSYWRNFDVVIDGNNTEWGDLTAPVGKTGLEIGAVNDEQFLYLTLSSQNPAVERQILIQGLTVWFDPEGNKAQTFGLRFPLGRRQAGRPHERMPAGGPPEDRPGHDQAHVDRMDEVLEEANQMLEILGAGPEATTLLPVGEARGIEVVLDRTGRRLLYELKIPLVADAAHPYAIGAAPGRVLGVGLESPERELPQGGFPGGMPRGRPGRGGTGPFLQHGGGSGGPPGGGGPGGPPGRGRPGHAKPEPIKFWAKVQLAANTNPGG